MMEYLKKLFDMSTNPFSMIYEVVEVLTKWDNSAAVNYAFNIYLLFVPLAMALALGYTILEIIESMTRNGGKDATTEMIVFPLVKFAAVVLLLRYGTNIVSAVMGGSNALLAEFASIPVQNSVVQHLANDGIAALLGTLSGGAIVGTVGVLIGALLPLIIVFLITIICGIIIACQVVTIKIEMLLQFAVMPLAIANILQGGIHSSGLRFIKHFIGNLFIMTAILLSIQITGMVSQNLMAGTTTWGDQLMSGIGTFFYSTLIGPIACVGVTNTVKSILREAFN